MRYQRVFEWGADENTGENGWLPTWLDGAEYPYAMTGNGTAHDVLEHEAHETEGDIETEIRALGAAFFVRGESGWFASLGSSHPEAEWHLASDFTEFYRIFAFEGGDIGKVDTSYPDPHWMKDTFRTVVRMGILGAFADCRGEKDNRESLLAFARLRPRMVQLMVEGYTAAYERFDGEYYTARDLFERISEASRAAAEHAEEHGEALFIVDVDTLAGKFRATCEIFENPTYGDILD